MKIKAFELELNQVFELNHFDNVFSCTAKLSRFQKHSGFPVAQTSVTKPHFSSWYQKLLYSIAILTVIIYLFENTNIK